MGMYMYKKDRKEILDYLESLQGKHIYDDELMDVKRKCFGFMGIESELFISKYSLKVFNGFLDDYFGKGTKNYYPSRFALRDDDKPFLPDGKENPHYRETYWRLIG